MKDSIPSRVQPVQAAQKPVICARDSLLRGFAAASAALEMLLMTLISLAFLPSPDQGPSRPAGNLLLRDLCILYTFSAWQIQVTVSATRCSGGRARRR